MTNFNVPFVIRGQVIRDSEMMTPARYGDGVTFTTPDVRKHLDRLVVRDPRSLADLYALTLDEVLDYVEALGGMLDFQSNAHLQAAYELALAAAPTTPPILETLFSSFTGMLSRTAMLEAIGDVGRDYLESWVRKDLASGSAIEVRAFGARSVAVVAGTGPVVSALAMMRNAITRGDTILKMPSNDPMTAAAIGMTMIDLDPDHPITRHYSAVYWRGGDEAVESRLYDPRHLEKIVVWGGYDAVKNVTRYLQPGLELIAWDPKLSSTIIGRDAFADDETMRMAAIRAAADIGYINQVGCASARVIYVQTGTDLAGIETARKFGAYVFEEIQNLPSSLSTPAKSFDPELKAEIDAVRLFEQDYYVVGGRTNEGAIIVSRHNEPVDFAPRLADRVGNLVPIDDIGEALAAITSYTQTIGVFPEGLKREIRDIAALTGMQRLVSLGYACRPTSAGPWDSMQPLARQCRWIVDQISDESRAGAIWNSDGKNFYRS